jgi:hypothetical protein
MVMAVSWLGCIRGIYKGAKSKLSGDVEQYEPGYFNRNYPVFVRGVDSKMNVEVLIQHE